MIEFVVSEKDYILFLNKIKKRRRIILELFFHMVNIIYTIYDYSIVLSSFKPLIIPGIITKDLSYKTTMNLISIIQFAFVSIAIHLLFRFAFLNNRVLLNKIHLGTVSIQKNSEKIIICSSEKGLREIKAGDVNRFLEREDFLLIRLINGEVVIIPKRYEQTSKTQEVYKKDFKEITNQIRQFSLRS